MQRDAPPDLAELTLADLEQWVASAGLPRYRAAQIFQWVWRRGATSFDAMSDLPRELRARLSTELAFSTPTVVRDELSVDGTRKLVLRFADRREIECVYIPDTPSQTFCVSTQVGCAMGCAFCLTGRMGLVRHLTAGEIAGQVRVLATATGLLDRAFNIVLMGMGEPLHNLANLLKALEVVNAEWGFHFGARRITVSTVGLPERIRELAQAGYQFNLAISLHATTDEQRTELIPTNKATGLSAILAAAADYFRATRREVTFEYTLVGGQNDTPKDAERLAALLLEFPRCNVNLIPMNPVEGSGLKEPTAEAVELFTRLLREAGVNVHVRRKRGRRVQAACGQLRLKLEAAPAQ